MARHKIPQPTGAELEILNTLWGFGNGTVRQVNEIINKKRTTGYTTTLKLMQIMAQKGLLVRDISRRTHVYRAKYAQKTTQKKMLSALLDKVFNGSAEKLVMQALTSNKMDPDELENIRKVLDELEGE